MHVKESILIALHCMRAGRLRTAITMLGIVISIAVVIAAGGLSSALNSSFRDNFNANFKSITVLPMQAQFVAGGAGARSITDADVEALRQESDPAAVADVIPTVSGMVMVRHGAEQIRGDVVGASAGFVSTAGGYLPLVGGRMFTDQQYEGKARTVLLSADIAGFLFGDPAAAVGGSVDIGRFGFQVIGVLGPAATDTALMPMTTARACLFGGLRTVSGITVLATQLGTVQSAINQTNSILDRQHMVTTPGLRDFGVTASQPINMYADQLLDLVVWFTAVTIMIALFISALGLANIMLVTVVERTSEIGIRRAVGARRAAIMRQFLIESMIIAGFGGALGVGLGVSVVLAGQWLLPMVAPLDGVPRLSIQVVAAAFGISLLVGLVAGAVPAYRASRLHPWHALCH